MQSMGWGDPADPEDDDPIPELEEELTGTMSAERVRETTAACAATLPPVPWRCSWLGLRW